MANKVGEVFTSKKAAGRKLSHRKKDFELTRLWGPELPMYKRTKIFHQLDLRRIKKE